VGSNRPSKLSIPSGRLNINYSNLEKVVGEDNLYQFDVPRGLFSKVSETEFVSNDLQATIKLNFNFTQSFDEAGIYSKTDLINRYKSQYQTTYVADKSNWFALSGLTANRNIAYVKGFYEEFYSMQGRDEGEPAWLWSKSGVIEIQYPKQYKLEFDILIPIITKSFKCDFINFPN